MPITVSIHLPPSPFINVMKFTYRKPPQNPVFQPLLCHCRRGESFEEDGGRMEGTLAFLRLCAKRAADFAGLQGRGAVGVYGCRYGVRVRWREAVVAEVRVSAASAASFTRANFQTLGFIGVRQLPWVQMRAAGGGGGDEGEGGEESTRELHCGGVLCCFFGR